MTTPEENPHPPSGKARHQYEKCKQCGHPFESQRANKEYGNFQCYVASSDFKRNIQKAHEATAQRKNLIECACGCGEHVHRPPSRINGNCYYSTACRRDYFAKRFDRFIATPCDIREAPHNYDEFLAQNELPCLVEGCSWSGKNLSTHVNLSHGVKASDFKRMAGFNSTTGVVGADYSRHLATVGVGHLPKGDNFKGVRRHGLNKGFKFRPEGLEHYRKARALKAVQE